jgi:hypothetical protein
MQGAGPDEVAAKLGKILQGADPPRSEEEVAMLLGMPDSASRYDSSPACSGGAGLRAALFLRPTDTLLIQTRSFR